MLLLQLLIFLLLVLLVFIIDRPPIWHSQNAAIGIISCVSSVQTGLSHLCPQVYSILDPKQASLLWRQVDDLRRPFSSFIVLVVSSSIHPHLLPIFEVKHT
jgi:hypothetical protein